MGSVNEVASSPDMIPIGNSPGTTQKSFIGLLDALSQIQQYYVIESSGHEIPENFLTINGKLNFFKIGMGSGIFEGVLFTLMTALLLPIIADPFICETVSKVFPLAQYKIFLFALNCLPILLIGGMCVFVSQYRIGTITKKSVDALLMGRVMSLAVKGIILFWMLIFLADGINQHTAWVAARVLSFGNTGENALIIYRVIWNLRPFIFKTAYDVLLIFGISAVIPFITTWAFAMFRGYRKAKNEKFWNE